MDKLLREDDDLERREYDLADEVKRARGAEAKDKLRKELVETVEKHFEVRQQRRELQIKRLEDELKKLRETMKARGESKDQIIKKYLTELLGDSDDMQF
jgi:flagellar biosynthesis/type III secretory pathway M-ring protein FliF/YscJ